MGTYQVKLQLVYSVHFTGMCIPYNVCVQLKFTFTVTYNLCTLLFIVYRARRGTATRAVRPCASKSRALRRQPVRSGCAARTGRARCWRQASRGAGRRPWPRRASGRPPSRVRRPSSSPSRTWPRRRARAAAAGRSRTGAESAAGHASCPQSAHVMSINLCSLLEQPEMHLLELRWMMPGHRVARDD